MKRICLLLLIMLVAGPGLAADDPLHKGMKLYKKHRYRDALQEIYPLLSTSPAARQKQIHLSLGLICYESARLYQELYHFSLTANRDYLQRLVADQSQSESRLAGLYLGKTLLLSGALDESAAIFEKFLAQYPGDSRDAQAARVDLGTIYHHQGRTENAQKLWAGLKPLDAATVTALAAAYSYSGMDDRKPAAMCRNALTAFDTKDRQPPIQVFSNTLAVYTRQGLIDESRRLLQQADLKACFQEEALLENKVIRFYDPILLLNLARFYGSAAAHHFQTAAGASDASISNWARAGLLDAQLLLGPPERAKSTADALMASKTLPDRLSYKVKIRQTVLNAARGPKESARQQLQALLRQKSDPASIADLLLTCGTARIDFPEAVIKAESLAQSGNGRRMPKLNLALGKHYLAQKDTAKSLTYLETDRDKRNKNRIEYNDPLLLVALAQAYYQQRYYSEALEIFFEMSKQVEAVRQLQVSIQGVYSIEQKSAGDVKLF